MTDLAEAIVIRWVERLDAPPAHLRDIVQRYRDLVFFVDTAPDVHSALPLMAVQDALFDRLLASVTAHGRVSVDKQVRRIERRLPLQAQWDRACERWRQSYAG